MEYQSGIQQTIAFMIDLIEKKDAEIKELRHRWISELNRADANHLALHGKLPGKE